MKNAYYSLTGFRLRLWMRLTFIVGLLLPKGFSFETKLIDTRDSLAEGDASAVQAVSVS